MTLAAGVRLGPYEIRRYPSLRSLSLPRRKPPPSLRSGDYSRRELMRECR